MKIAIISDIHGNLTALLKVLSDIENRSVDKIVFLGDLCTLGPDSLEVTEVLLEKCRDNILGNHDEYLFNEKAIYSYTNEKIIIDSILYAKSILPTDTINNIKSFSYTLELQTDEGYKICFYHGSPKSNTDSILSDTEFNKVDSIFSEFDSNIFIGGHTHIQMYKKYLSNYIINCGSVGQPFKATNKIGQPEIISKSEYCILHTNKESIYFEFIQLDYDISTHVKRIMGSDLPLKYWLKSQYNF